MNRLPTFPKSAYGPIAPRLQGVARTYPSTRGWGSGWPDCHPEKLVRTVGVHRPSDGQGFNRLFRKEAAGLVAYLMQTTMDLGYEFRQNAEPDGGVSTYNCRAIKGTTDKPSWHSWGLAIDINSAGNPMLLSNPDGFRSTQPPWMVDLWESSGFYWGGRYTKYADCMHFEYMFRPADIAVDFANAHLAAERIRFALFPPTPEVPVTPEQIKALQQALNDLGWLPLLQVDGNYGPLTDTAVQSIAALIGGKLDVLEQVKALLAGG